MRKGVKYNGKINFIHFISINGKTSELVDDDIPSTAEINEFHETIQQINPNCKYELHILINPDNHNKTDKINHLLVENTNTRVHFMKRLYKSKDNIEIENMHGYNWNWKDIYRKLGE